MQFTGILFALLYAVILTAVFSMIFKNTGPWNGFWIFFFLLFFVALGAGEWSAPAGPAAWGYYWLPGLIAAVIFALVLAAATPESRPSGKINRSAGTINELSNKKIEGEEETAVAVAVIGIFFWILILVLILAAIAGIIRGYQDTVPRIAMIF